MYLLCVGGCQCSSDLADHGAAVVDELGQHHGHVVVDGGGVVRPLRRVSHKRAQSKNSCTPHLQRRKHSNAFNSLSSWFKKAVMTKKILNDFTCFINLSCGPLS